MEGALRRALPIAGRKRPVHHAVGALPKEVVDLWLLFLDIKFFSSHGEGKCTECERNCSRPAAGRRYTAKIAMTMRNGQLAWEVLIRVVWSFQVYPSA